MNMNNDTAPRNAAPGADEFSAAGRLLWGARWQRPMQDALQINQIARIRAWASGATRIPAGVWDEIDKLLEERGNCLDDLRQEIQSFKKPA